MQQEQTELSVNLVNLIRDLGVQHNWLGDNVSQLITDVNSGIFTSVYCDKQSATSNTGDGDAKVAPKKGGELTISFKTLMNDFVAVKTQMKKRDEEIEAFKARDDDKDKLIQSKLVLLG